MSGVIFIFNFFYRFLPDLRREYWSASAFVKQLLIAAYPSHSECPLAFTLADPPDRHCELVMRVA